MSDHERIYLQPECCATPDVGRMWCEDPDPVDCDEGVLWTEYVRADLSPWRPWEELDPEEHDEVLAAWQWRDREDPPEVHHIYYEDGPEPKWIDGDSETVLIQPEAWMPIPDLPEVAHGTD